MKGNVGHQRPNDNSSEDPINNKNNRNSNLQELRRKPFTKEERQEGKIVIHKVPDETTEDEISELLRGWIFDLDIKSIRFMRPKQPGVDGVLSLKAFVEFSSDEWANRIMNYYEQHKTNVGTRGYTFTNSKNVTSELFFEYCLNLKDKKYNFNNSNNNRSNTSNAKRSGSRGPLDNAKSATDPVQNVIDEIANIKHGRALFLKNIQNMENELKKRIPDLFVSEFELNNLRREDYELNEKIKVQCIALESGRQTLKGVQEDLEQLNKLYNEDLDDEMAQLKLNTSSAPNR